MLRGFNMLRGFLLIFFSLCVLAHLGNAGEGNRLTQRCKKVLVLHSYHEGLRWTDGQNLGIKQGFEQRGDVELDIEYLDSKRIPLERIAEQFATFLMRKYGNSVFDAVIVTDDNALTFISEFREKMFAGVPIVFCGINNYKVEYLKDFNGRLTGVVQAVEPAATIALIRKLQPGLRSLVIISDKTPTSLAKRDEARVALGGMKYGFDTVWLHALETATLKQRIKELNGNDAILLCNFNRDADGVYYAHDQSARMITRISHAPVYAMEDQYLGTGVVGGYMQSSKEQGRTAAAICLEVLDSGRVPPVNMNSKSRVIFDFTAMKRFGLSISKLPPSALIINRPLSFYQQNKAMIWNIVGGFTLLLLAFLSTVYWLIHSKIAERQYRLLAENTVDLIWTCRKDTDDFALTYINPAVREMLGYTVEEYLALPLEKRIDPECVEIIRQSVAHMQTSEQQTLEVRCQHKDGRLIECELWIRPLVGDNGAISGFQGRTIDITARKVAEKRLAEINACMAGLSADYNENVNALTELCGRLLRADFALYSRLQNGMLCSLGSWQVPEEISVLNTLDGSLCYDVIKRGKSEPFVVRDLSRSIYAQSNRTIEKYGLRTYLGYPAVCAGEIVGLLCLFFKEDVDPSPDDLRIIGIIALAVASEEGRRRAAHELHRMQKLEELGTVAGGIAHDFNNLLTGVFGNLELAKMSLVSNPEAAGFCLDQAAATIESARGLTTRLLTFARGGEPLLDAVDITELIRETVDFNLHGSRITAAFDLPDDLWLIEADKAQIGQVIANLVVNARQAMPNGGVLKIRARNQPRNPYCNKPDQSRDMIHIEIIDEGSGIPAAIADRIFDPYFTTRQGGHGLGLAVVQSIIVQHKGVVDVGSAPGGGAVFSIMLPALPDKTCVARCKPATESGSVRKHELRILLMDDDALVRRVAVAMIDHMGHTITTAVNGEEAIEKYKLAMQKGEPYDIVIMDLTIRGGTGGEKSVGKVLQLNPSARVIVASGYASDPVLANFRDYGFVAKLAKPYTMNELKEVIDQVGGI